MLEALRPLFQIPSTMGVSERMLGIMTRGLLLGPGWPYGVQVATSREKSARNAAAVSYLRSVKAGNLDKITNEQIAERSGINYETVKRLMRNKANLTLDEFLDIADALGVDNTTALTSLAEITRKLNI